MGCDIIEVYKDHVNGAKGREKRPASRWLDAEHDRARRVKVGVDLSVPSPPDIFVVGDNAAMTDQPGISGTAPAAKRCGGNRLPGFGAATNASAPCRTRPTPE